MFDGPPPLVIACADEGQECGAVAGWIKDRIDEGCAPNEVGVFVWSDAELYRARAAAKAAGVRSVELSENVEERVAWSPSVQCTSQRALSSVRL